MKEKRQYLWLFSPIIHLPGQEVLKHQGEGQNKKMKNTRGIIPNKEELMVFWDIAISTTSRTGVIAPRVHQLTAHNKAQV